MAAGRSDTHNKSLETQQLQSATLFDRQACRHEQVTPPPTVPHPLCRIPLAAHRCSECCRGAERLERFILGGAIWLHGLREGVCTADCAAPTRQRHLESTCASKQIRQQHHESICCVYGVCCAAVCTALAVLLRLLPICGVCTGIDQADWRAQQEAGGLRSELSVQQSVEAAQRGCDTRDSITTQGATQRH